MLTTGGTGLGPRDVTPEATAERARARRARDRRGDPRRLAGARRRTPCSRAGSPGCVGRALVVNLPGSPGGCRDGFAVLRPALEHAVELLAGEPTRAPADMTERSPYPRALRVARQDRAHALRAAVRLRRRVPGRRRRAERARPALDHGRDGRRPLAGDGPEPADRRRARRAQPAHGRPRAARRACSRRPQVVAFCAASLAVFLVAVFQLDPIVHWLWPIPVAGFVIYPYLKRFTWLCHFWLGAVDGLAPVGAWAAITGDDPVAGVGARRRGRALGDRLRLLLRAVRPRDRPRAGAALGRGRASASGARSAARGSATLGTVALLVAAGLGLPVDAFYWIGVAVVAGAARVRALARAAGRPAAARHGVLHDERRDLRRVLRLRARWTCSVIRGAPALGKRYGAKRVLRGLDFELAARRLHGRHRRRTAPGKTTLLRLCAGLAIADRRHARGRAGARRDRLPRPRAARLPRADRAREPRALRAALPRARAARADRDAARAVRPVGVAARAGGDVLARHAAAARRSAGRSCTSPSCSSSTSRSTRSTTRAPSCSTASSPSMRERRTFLVATHDPGGSRRCASGRLALRRRRTLATRPREWWPRRTAVWDDSPTPRRSRARTCCSSCGRGRRCRRCCCSCSRRSSSSTSRCPPAPSTLPSSGCSGSRSSSPRCSASPARSRPSASRARSTGSCSRRATAARSGSAKTIATLAFLLAAELVALPAFALFFEPVGWRPRRRRRCSPTSASARSGRCSPRWPPPAARASCSCRCSSCRSRSRRGRRRRRERRRRPGRYLGFLALYDVIFVLIAWASFEYVVTE